MRRRLVCLSIAALAAAASAPSVAACTWNSCSIADAPKTTAEAATRAQAAERTTALPASHADEPCRTAARGSTARRAKPDADIQTACLSSASRDAG